MNRFLPLSLAALASAGLFAGTAVLAQPAPETSLTRAAAETRAAQAFTLLDANSDGQLTQADRGTFAREQFDAADTDKNGQLSFAEASAMHQQNREMRGDRREERGARMERMGMQRMGMERMRGPMRGAMLERADTDNDGAVSQAEFAAHALARFDQADADSNGTISADERRAMRGERMGQRSRRG
jgi:Ca2+-binding EF-hand superfamily protein